MTYLSHIRECNLGSEGKSQENERICPNYGSQSEIVSSRYAKRRSCQAGDCERQLVGIQTRNPWGMSPQVQPPALCHLVCNWQFLTFKNVERSWVHKCFVKYFDVCDSLCFFLLRFKHNLYRVCQSLVLLFVFFKQHSYSVHCTIFSFSEFIVFIFFTSVLPPFPSCVYSVVFSFNYIGVSFLYACGFLTFWQMFVWTKPEVVNSALGNCGRGCRKKGRRAFPSSAFRSLGCSWMWFLSLLWQMFTFNLCDKFISLCWMSDQSCRTQSGKRTYWVWTRCAVSSCM